MASFFIPPLKTRFFDGNGDPLAGGKLYTYAAGTTSPKVTYTDYELTQNTNPIILDANGECVCRIDTGYYKFVLTDANDVVQWTLDRVGHPTNTSNGLPSGGSAGQVAAKVDGTDYNVAWTSLQYIAETAFTIVNNQSTVADVTGLLFDKTQVGSAIITYWIKRYTTSTGATNLVEAGTMIATYDLATETWSLTPLGAGPNDSGVTLTITSAGQVQYTSSNITGTPSVSKMKFKATSLGT